VSEPDGDDLEAMSDEELIAIASRSAHHDRHALELQRRTNVHQAELTAAMREYMRSADRSARWMLIATLVLVVLTILLAILTLVLVIDPPAEPDL
jgi:hypothetical protein